MPEQISKSAPRVLVVEGRGELREALKDALGATFFVTTARSAEGALAGIETYRPRAVLACEKQSGELDGLELCKQLREQPLGKDCLLIVYGGERNDSEGAKKTYGLDEYVDKGVTLKQLDELLCKHLRLGWVPMAQSTEALEEDTGRWRNPLTERNVISARKGDEPGNEAKPKKKGLFSRFFRS